MFKWLNKTGVESDNGFAVQSMDRFTIEYREGLKKISVDVERGFADGNKPCVILVEPNAFERWDNGAIGERISPEKQRQILANFVDALEFQGLAVVLP